MGNKQLDKSSIKKNLRIITSDSKLNLNDNFTLKKKKKRQSQYQYE